MILSLLVGVDKILSFVYFFVVCVAEKFQLNIIPFVWILYVGVIKLINS
jgi:hypothetical protein